MDASYQDWALKLRQGLAPVLAAAGNLAGSLAAPDWGAPEAGAAGALGAVGAPGAALGAPAPGLP